MGDPYWRYAAPSANAGSIPMASYPGYFPSETSPLSSHRILGSNGYRASSSDYVQKDVLPLQHGAYGVDITRIGVPPEPVIGGLTASASIRGYPTSLQGPNLLGHRPDAIGVGSGIADLVTERSGSLTKVDAPLVSAGESNILFVDGLPSDCSRREAGHLFRPFIGYKDIRVIHKEPRRSGDKAMVFCFVEFSDVKCALTAMEALQGYKFDDKKPESPALRIHFAHFPFQLPTERR